MLSHMMTAMWGTGSITRKVRKAKFLSKKNTWQSLALDWAHRCLEGFRLRKEEKLCEWRTHEDEEFSFIVKGHIVIPKQNYLLVEDSGTKRKGVVCLETGTAYGPVPGEIKMSWERIYKPGEWKQKQKLIQPLVKVICMYIYMYYIYICIMHKLKMKS